MKVKVNCYSKKIGERLVLDRINYSFESGKIYGLYGRNGSGKTMLLRAISGLIFPTEGSVTIDGRLLHQEISFPESLGLIVDKTELLPDFDGFTNLNILAGIKKIATKDDIRHAMMKVGLDPDSKKKVSQYSMGMKQKLSIAQAIFENPDLLLLDEPTNALDHESVIRLRELLLQLKERGCLIVITSHNIEDLEVLTDERINLDEGRIVITGGNNYER